MKKIKPVFLAVLIGSVCAFMLFKEFKEEIKPVPSGNVVAIQIGVFTKSENAEAMKKNYGGIVSKDGDLYRVYYAVLSEDANIDFVTKYLQNQGINYYLKNITLENDILKRCEEYEVLMQKTNEETKLAINKEILKLYGDVV